MTDIALPLRPAGVRSRPVWGDPGPFLVPGASKCPNQMSRSASFQLFEPWTIVREMTDSSQEADDPHIDPDAFPTRVEMAIVASLRTVAPSQKMSGAG